MVNEVVLSYVESNKGKFPMKEIRAKILSRGYSKEDIDEAIDVLKKKKVVLEDNFGLKRKVEAEESDELKKVALRKKSEFKWMKMAGIIGLVFFGIAFLSFVLGLFDVNVLPDGEEAWVGYFNLVLFFISMVAFCFYYFGFVKLGGFANSGVLEISSVVCVVFSVLLLLLFVASLVFGLFVLPDVNSVVAGSSPVGDNSPVVGCILLGLLFAMIVFRYLFAIGLIRIRKKVKFSLVAGIFGLIGIVFITLLVGFFVYLMINPTAFISVLLSLGARVLTIILWTGRAFGVLVLAILLFEALTLLSGSKKFE